MADGAAAQPGAATTRRGPHAHGRVRRDALPARARGLPRVQRALDTGDTGAQLPPAPAFLRFGSWVGGDRDGNPQITAQVTRETMLIQSEHVLRGLEAATTRIGTGLTADVATTPPDARFSQPAALAPRHRRARAAGIEARSPGEPYRQFLLLVAERIGATRRADLSVAYVRPDELIDDLRCLQDALVTAGAPRQAYGELHGLIWQAQTFGFHLADLEIRQHSGVHRTALGRDRMPAARAHRRPTRWWRRCAPSRCCNSDSVRTACHRYVVSFTTSAEDIARRVRARGARLRAQRLPPSSTWFRSSKPSADLRNARETLDAMLELEPVRRRMAATGRALEVMLGYSDSAKESGPVTATLALYSAQADLAAWAARAMCPADALPRSGRCPWTRRRSGKSRCDGAGAGIGGGTLQGHRTGRGDLRPLRQRHAGPAASRAGDLGRAPHLHAGGTAAHRAGGSSLREARQSPRRRRARRVSPAHRYRRASPRTSRR